VGAAQEKAKRHTPKKTKKQKKTLKLLESFSNQFLS